VSAVRSFWRVLLVWLTVLAIPVQGVAAARMTHCLAAPASVHEHGSHGSREALDSPERHDAHHRHQQRHQQGHHDHHAITGDAHAVPHARMAEAAAMVTTAAVADAEWSADADAMPATPAVSPLEGKPAGVEKKCSACAACCAAAALPTYVAEVPRLDLLSTPTSLIEAASVSFIAGGPERPPRTHLA
jgi:hypothetical protein